MKWSFMCMIVCFMFAYLLMFVVGDEFWFFLGYLYVLGGFGSAIVLAMQIYTGDEELLK